jgi:hypothetical protein
MKKIINGIIGLLLAVSCQGKPNNISQQSGVIGCFKAIININDSIGTKAFANKLLQGLTKVSDDNLTFACMDSLASNKVEIRDFYWQVFQVILVKSDGALSEAVGSYLIAYLQKYPSEFTKRYSKLNKTLKLKCVHFVAYEEYFMDEIDELKMQRIMQFCKHCQSKEKNIMAKFAKEVLTEVKNMKK